MPLKGRKYARNKRDLLRLADLMAVKATITQICERLAISDVTLCKYYGRELEAAGYPIMGRRREPTEEHRKMVAHLRSIGVSFANISAAMGMYSVDALKELFPDEIRKGDAHLDIRLRHAIVDAATNWHRRDGTKDAPVSAVSPLIFLGKAILGLRDTQRTELTGADGKPIQQQVEHAIVILPSNGRDETPALTDESEAAPLITLDGEVVEVTPDGEEKKG